LRHAWYNAFLAFGRLPGKLGKEESSYFARIGIGRLQANDH